MTDLSDDDKKWAFQRLNIYHIVAALGSPSAAAACTTSIAATDFYLPPGTVIPPANVQRQRNRKVYRRQHAAAAPGRALPPAAPARGQNRREPNQGTVAVTEIRTIIIFTFSSCVYVNPLFYPLFLTTGLTLTALFLHLTKDYQYT